MKHARAEQMNMQNPHGGLGALDNINAPPEVKQRMCGAAMQMAAEAIKQRSLEQLRAQCTREAAAAHEAGHAIVHAYHGTPLRYVKVFRAEGLWLGWTLEKGDKWSLKPGDGPEAHLAQARIFVAGVCGEAHAGYDVVGSSIDEIVASQVLVMPAAAQLGESPEEIWYRMRDETAAILKKHEAAHQALSRLLRRERRVEGNRLQVMLASVYQEAEAAAA